MGDLDEVAEDEWEMVGWQPAEYLFEYDLITFTAEVAETTEAETGGGNGKDSAPGQNKNPGEPATGKGKNK